MPRNKHIDEAFGCSKNYFAISAVFMFFIKNVGFS